MTYASIPEKFRNHLGGINLLPGRPDIVDNQNSLEFLVYMMLANKKQIDPMEWDKIIYSCRNEDGTFHRLGIPQDLISHDTLVNILTGSIVCGRKHIAWEIYNHMVKNGFQYKNVKEDSEYRANHTRQFYFMAHLYVCCEIVPPIWDQILWTLSLIYSAIRIDGMSGLLLRASTNEAYHASNAKNNIMSIGLIVFDTIMFVRKLSIWRMLGEYFSQTEIKQYCLNQAKNK